MPLDLNTSIAFLKTRVDQTLAVQRAIAPTWTWPLRTLAEWEADSLQLDRSQPDTAATRALAAKARAESARGALDARLAAIHEQTVSVIGVMRVRAERTPEHRDVVDNLSARGDSRRGIEDEGAALISAWKEEFGPDFRPAPEITLASFSELFVGVPASVPPAPAVPAVPSLRALKQALSDAATVERRETGRISVLLNRVENDAQQWYAEATSIYRPGTEIGDLLRSSISTSSDYAGPGPAA